jgi:hypothetical protein
MKSIMSVPPHEGIPYSPHQPDNSLAARLDRWFERAIILTLLALLGYGSMNALRYETPLRWITPLVSMAIFLLLLGLGRRINFLKKLHLLLSGIFGLVGASVLLLGSDSGEGFLIYRLPLLATAYALFLALLLVGFFTMAGVLRGKHRWQLALGFLGGYCCLPLIVGFIRKIPLEDLTTALPELNFLPEQLLPGTLLFSVGLPLLALGLLGSFVIQLGQGQRSRAFHSGLLGLFLIFPLLGPLAGLIGNMTGHSQRGLEGRYYRGETYEQLALSRRDEMIDFSWTKGPAPEIGPVPFFAEWLGNIQTPASGRYVFRLETSGKAMLYLDGKILLDTWSSPQPMIQAEIKLQGYQHEFRLQSFSPGGIGQLRLAWIRPGSRGFQRIPASAFTRRAHPRTPREAAQLGLSWLQSTALRWDQQYRCIGCHVQTFGLMGLAIGKRMEYRVDGTIIKQLMESLRQYQNADGSYWKREAPLTATQFAGMALAHYSREIDDQADQVLQKIATFLRGRLSEDHLGPDTIEAPIDMGDIQHTVNTMLVFNRNYERFLDSDSLSALNRLHAWLLQSQPVDSQETVFKILGLSLFDTPEDEAQAKRLITELYQRQNSDGSWSEQSDLTAGSAYTTGQVLYALKVAGESVFRPEFRRAVDFLMNRQYLEGYWKYTPGQDTHSHRPSMYAPTMWAALGLANAYGRINLEISDPLDQSDFHNGQPVSVIIENYSDAPIKFVEYFVDGLFYGRVRQEPYRISLDLPDGPPDLTPSASQSSPADVGDRLRIAEKIRSGREFELFAKAVAADGQEATDRISLKYAPSIQLRLERPSDQSYVTDSAEIELFCQFEGSPKQDLRLQLAQETLPLRPGQKPNTYLATWNCRDVADGHYPLTATARNMAGQTETSRIELIKASGKIRVISAELSAAFPDNTEIILDASGSMLGLVKNETGRLVSKITVAKNTVRSLLETVPSGKNLGLRVYGQRYPRSAQNCRDSELVVPVEAHDPAMIKAKIAAIEARGMTPIAYSLERAAQDLSGKRATVVLVSDGEESCRGDPCRVASQISQAGPLDLRIHVIGFDIADLKTRHELECIAEAGHGRFFLAGNARELQNAIKESVQLSFDLFQKAETIEFLASGLVNGPAIPVPPGQYQLKVYTTPPFLQDVTIQPEQLSEIRLPGSKP